MNANSLRRRVLARFFDAHQQPTLDTRPPATSGYSALRRIVAGLLGVRLPERDRGNAAVAFQAQLSAADVGEPLSLKEPVTNVVSGTAYGAVVQAGTIVGGVHFHGRGPEPDDPQRRPLAPASVPHFAQALAGRMLWSQAVGERPRPQPMVVLLGPAGAGKTTAVESISGYCGSRVVHTLFDFDRAASVTTVEVLAQIAFGLSRNWPVRRPVRFTRFTLGLIAVQADLDTVARDHAKDTLRATIDRFVRRPGFKLLPEQVSLLFDPAQRGPILRPALAETNAVLPLLIRAVGRKRLAGATRGDADIPEAVRETPLDALVELNRWAQTDPAQMTAWLTSAFLADIWENKHLRSWMLLLDNVDHASGQRFLTDLEAARGRHLAQHPGEHDPLLIIATSSRWNRDWQSDWFPPWKPPSGRTDQVRVVPRCRDAGYEQWAGNRDVEHPPPGYYPVLLEPLDIDEIARVLGTTRYSPKCALVHRATGGLPGAVHEVARLLRDREPRPGSRDALLPPEPAMSAAEIWRARVEKLHLARGLPNVGVEELITAAPFATAPWLVSGETTRLPVGRILTELRNALWVTAPSTSGAARDHAVLHPWVARTLLVALAARREGPRYEDQFEALLNDPATQADPARTAYCQLALGQVSTVVNALEGDFDSIEYRDWIQRLELVTSAPDNQPFDVDCADLCQELVNEDIRWTGRNRSRIRTVLTRLVVARWLMSNPFATPDPELGGLIANAYGELAVLARRPDVSELYQAVERARKLF